MQQVATSHELYSHPVNRFVAGFLGSPGMNLLELPLARDRARHLATGVGHQFRTSRRDEHGPIAHRHHGDGFGNLPIGASPAEQVFDRVLVSIGRKPNPVPGIEKTKAKVNERGFVEVARPHQAEGSGEYRIRGEHFGVSTGITQCDDVQVRPRFEGAK